jgi:hypothetical protein
LHVNGLEGGSDFLKTRGTQGHCFADILLDQFAAGLPLIRVPVELSALFLLSAQGAGALATFKGVPTFLPPKIPAKASSR